MAHNIGHVILEGLVTELPAELIAAAIIAGVSAYLHGRRSRGGNDGDGADPSSSSAEDSTEEGTGR
ncbi:hypothetical protein [Micromonospora endolithica]|uniref:hypothetical protein n=1 Tax=Micromonospora endolithica TaxID=230091 RepID=UPI0011AC0ECA|nr:hypothetical protein [Micromonospora endolithica]TWJ20744.1 hypothetical protein JD76_00843 [Micromonospora endolithica]